jgi:hypothetical protein
MGTTAGWARTAGTTMRSVSDMGHDVAAEAGGEPALRTQWRETANEEMR